MPRVRVPRHVAWLITRLVAPLVVDYFAYAVHPGASARRAARHAACRRLLRLRRASGCLGTLCGSSSTTSRTLGIRVPRHIARHITRLVVDYFALRRLVVDYFAYAARPGASAHRAARLAARRQLLRLHRAAHHVAHHAARRRVLRLRRASGCLGTPRGLSRGSSSITSPRAGSLSTTSPTPRLVVNYFASRRLIVDYFAYATHPGASAHRAARHRLLHLRRVSGCLGTSRGSSRVSSSITSPRTGSSSTTLPTPRVRVPREDHEWFEDRWKVASLCDE
jgi:hypothetical protein